ncbi:hypothetical protein [Salibacterium sp. K-3]
MDPLCVSVTVFGSYTKYIPYFIYSVLKSYPSYYVKVFTNTTLSPSEQRCLMKVRQKLSGRFTVYENYFARIDTDNRQVGKMMRFLVPFHQYKNFESVYIGDVDFLIVNETPGLFESHKRHCKKINLPYSNQIRSGAQRLSGLHFFQTKPYYKKMNEVLNYYREHPRKLAVQIEKGGGNEQVLYQWIKKHIGFGRIEKYPYRPHHGFHLGIIRNGTERFDSYVTHGPHNPVHRLPPYPSLKKKLMVYYNDPLFKTMMRIHPVREIQRLQQLLQTN